MSDWTAEQEQELIQLKATQGTGDSGGLAKSIRAETSESLAGSIEIEGGE